MWLLTKLRENQDFELSILLLKLTGVWSPNTSVRKTPLNRLHDAAIALTLAVGVLTGTLLVPLGALTHTSDLSVVLECIGVGFMELMTVVKVWCIYLRVDTFKEFTSRIALLRKRDMTEDFSNEKQNIVCGIQKWVNFFVSLTVAYLVILPLGFFPRLVAMFTKKKLFARIWFPVDPYESPTFEILFVVWSFTFLVAVTCNPCVEGLGAAVMLKIIGQFKMLRQDISRLREDSVEVVRLRHEQRDGERRRCRRYNPLAVYVRGKTTRARIKETEDEMGRRLGDCVRRYQECLRLVFDLEWIFGPILIIQIAVVAPLLAFVFFASLKPPESLETMDAIEAEKLHAEHLESAVLYGGVVISLCCELCAMCFLMDKITEESDLVRDAVFSCDWLESPESFKRSMRIVMSRSNQPLYVRASGFVPLTQESFLGIMHLVFSYYTTMSTLVHGENNRFSSLSRN